jgi:hypothetical protein
MVALTMIIPPSSARGQPAPTSQPAPAADDQSPPTRQEFNAMKQELDQTKAELADVKKKGEAAPTSEDMDDFDRRLKEVNDAASRALPGKETVVIAGDASVGFTVPRHGHSTFSAGVSPLILYTPAPKLLFEAAADIGVSSDSVGNSSTSFDLTIADASYQVCDNFIIGGGLFVVPFGVYHSHFDPPWINKFPDDPLAFGDNPIAPGSEVGIFGRGAIPVGSTKFTYDVYLTNGPQLITDDPAAAGTLNFDDFTDFNNNKAVGGRIGFLPAPNVEMGYSIQYSKPGADPYSDVTALLQAVDLNWRQEVHPLAGVFDIRGEWVWSNVGTATYDPTGTLGFGPLTIGNHSNGGYAQFCYRPTLVTNKIIRNFELVSRFDYLSTPIGSPGGEREHRETFGVDYWLAPNAVLKVAYELDNKTVGDDQNQLLVQFGIGL